MRDEDKKVIVSMNLDVGSIKRLNRMKAELGFNKSAMIRLLIDEAFTTYTKIGVLPIWGGQVR